ncbi:hypothetical protein AURDEDRAFT_187854, partial [Auricularia subglabra TFB-10046 SS5]
MSSRSSQEGAGAGAALFALRVITVVAREAVDGVPVVKQVIGVLSHILSLAEKGDRNREALRVLAETSFAFAEAIKNVLDGQQLDGLLSDSLGTVLRIAQDVKPLMERHAAKNRFVRALEYAIALAPQIERLSGELSNAVRMLNLMVALDTNARVRAGNTIALENARYDGEFRLLRHCDVTKKELILEKFSWQGAATTKYHRAEVDGRVFVVRYSEGTQRQGATAYDRLLEQVSMVQTAHPNVAQIYGWSRGTRDERFTVFKAGFLQASK